MNRMVKDTLILFAITLVAGLGLGFVFNITKNARNEQEEKVKIEAYRDVMPQMVDYKPISFDAKKINQYIENKTKTNEKQNNISPIKEVNAVIDDVILTTDKDGKELGYIVTVTDNEAYSGKLQMTVGVLSDKTVSGISFLSLNETPGLGMKAKDDTFKSQFQNKKVDFFVYNKAGKQSENEIDAISSATITTNAVTHGTNAAIYCVDYLTGGEGVE